MLNDAKTTRVAGAPRWIIIVGVVIVMSMAGALGIVRATNAQLDKVSRVETLTKVLSPASAGVENYLLVGSDSRASADPTDPDYKNVGSEDANPGQRSDTMIVIRVDKKNGSVSTMSIPRDLYVHMGDSNQFAKINAAYHKGTDILVRTVQRALNIPIHHYVDINFDGFKNIVDAIGGVHICVNHESRDKATGFYINRKRCKLQNGVKALAYARSRHFEERIDGVWKEDATGDIGRGKRQRAFMSALAKDAVKYLAEHPFKTNSVLDSLAGSVTVDGGLQLLDLAKKLRPMADGSMKSYELPVDSDMNNGIFVLRLNSDASPLLEYFAGLGSAPAQK